MPSQPLFREPHPSKEGEKLPATPSGAAQATCEYYVSIEQPECGVEAPHRVRVPLGKRSATVKLCNEHKAVHDMNNAARRAARREADRRISNEQ